MGTRSLLKLRTLSSEEVHGVLPIVAITDLQREAAILIIELNRTHLWHSLEVSKVVDEQAQLLVVCWAGQGQEMNNKVSATTEIVAGVEFMLSDAEDCSFSFRLPKRFHPRTSQRFRWIGTGDVSHLIIPICRA